MRPHPTAKRLLDRLASPAEQGVITAMTAGLLLAVTTALALLIEAGSAVAAHRELLDTADAGARAGATALDLEVYRASGGRVVQLDPDRARQTVLQHLRANDHSGTAQVQVTTSTVTVRLAQIHPPVVFAFVRPTRLTAASTAAPQTGITEPQP